MQSQKQIVIRPGATPDTEANSEAGETYHYRYANGEKMDPVVYVYPTTSGRAPDGEWGGEGPNYEIVFGATRTEVQQKLETYLEAAGYEVRSQVEVVQDDPNHKPYFPTKDISISAPNVEIGVTIPEVDMASDGFVLTKPGSVMLVGGDIRKYASGYQPTICHLIDHATGDLFTIPAAVSDHEVLALLQARRRYVQDNHPGAASGPATPPSDEMVN